MVDAAVQLEDPRVALPSGQIRDRLIGHEEPDQVGEFPRVAEVDRVRRTLEHDEQHVALGLASAISEMRDGPGMSGSFVPTTTRVGMRISSSRASVGYLVSARNSWSVLGTPNRT